MERPLGIIICCSMQTMKAPSISDEEDNNNLQYGYFLVSFLHL